MCTAISFKTKDHYFGRNLDLEHSYNESVAITPRKYPFTFMHVQQLQPHYAMIGMATVENSYPLYYEATNEHGLSMAGLNFPGNATYHPETESKQNIATFEFIPWILGQCKTVSHARILLQNLNLTNTAFSPELPPSPLHWMLSDKSETIVVEPMASGIRVFDNPVGVLTNNPPFDYHMHHLCEYLNLTAEEPHNRFSEKVGITPYSRGMGGIGLPGDLSSSSRFIRATFTKLNSVCNGEENASVSQFFHILNSVSQQRGCVRINGSYEKTIYSSCCNTDKGIYYYKTYENSQITGMRLFSENLEADSLITFPLVTEQQIRYEN